VLLGALLVRALLLEALLQARPAWRLRYRRHLPRALLETLLRALLLLGALLVRARLLEALLQARPAWRLRHRRHLPRALVECSVVPCSAPGRQGRRSGVGVPRTPSPAAVPCSAPGRQGRRSGVVVPAAWTPPDAVPWLWRSRFQPGTFRRR
jgi:hypothetical protein